MASAGMGCLLIILISYRAALAFSSGGWIRKSISVSAGGGWLGEDGWEEGWTGEGSEGAMCKWEDGRGPVFTMSIRLLRPISESD